MAVGYTPQADNSALVAALVAIKDNTAPKVWSNVPMDTEEADGRANYSSFSYDVGTYQSDWQFGSDASNYLAFTGDENTSLAFFKTLIGADEIYIDYNGLGISSTTLITYNWAAAALIAGVTKVGDPSGVFAFANDVPSTVLIVESIVEKPATAKTITVPAFIEGSIHTFGTEGVTYDVINGESGETIHAGEDKSFDSLSDDPRQRVDYAGLSVYVPAGSRARVLAKAHPDVTGFDITVA